jgi:hypothetical protein
MDKFFSNNSGDFAVELDFDTTDMTGTKYLATIKRKLSQLDADADATLEGTIAGTSATLTFPHAVMSGLSGEYHFDIALIDTEGNRSSIPPDEPALLTVSTGGTQRQTTPEED